MFTENARNLISALLTVDPEKRLTAKQALKHPWLRDAPLTIDFYTDKEKKIILKEYNRLNPNKMIELQEEEVLFTEYNLETQN